RRRPSLATILALLALVISMGGTSYAAASINGKNLVNNSVPGKKLVGNTVNGDKINESSLGWVPKAKKAKMVTGPVNVRSASFDIPNGQSALVVASCESGELRTGGGGYFANGSAVAADTWINGSYPDGAAAWAARGWNESGSTQAFIAYVLCLASG
ncbi:MAG TPA: hypothetical protein PLZ93_12090, partial [Nocardioides sp.]|nr:hypothetical protein [Nocardioides sp.]